MQEQQKLIEQIIESKTSMVLPELFQMPIRHFDKMNSLEGDIVECGVWKGGYSIFLSKLFNDKKIWVCDSYEGCQDPSQGNYYYDRERHSLGMYAASLEEVKDNFRLFEALDESRVKFLKGWVKDTLPTADIDKISILRVDVDSYSATLEVLDALYDKVVEGGYIIFDDLCLYESKDAVYDFLLKKNLPLEVIDPVTEKVIDLNIPYYESNSGFASGSYIIKK
jgi:O-methyltransferase